MKRVGLVLAMAAPLSVGCSWRGGCLEVLDPDVGADNGKQGAATQNFGAKERAEDYVANEFADQKGKNYTHHHGGAAWRSALGALDRGGSCCGGATTFAWKWGVSS